MTIPSMSSTDHLAACIDIGGSKAILGLVTADGQEVARERFPVAAAYDPRELADLLATRMRHLAAQAGLSWDRIRGLGYSTTGMLDVDSGTIFSSPNQGGWVDVPFAPLLAQAFGLPVRIEMDANAAALGERWLGAGEAANPFILVIVGTGIGAGIISDGKVFRGHRGTAGEFGHLSIDPHGPLCYCGNRGCLESIASGPAITNRVRQALAEGGTGAMAGIDHLCPETVFQLAREGDALAQDIVTVTVESLAQGITNLIHLLNPQVIAIGGGVGLGAADLLLDPLRASVRQRVGSWVDMEQTRIVNARLANDAGLLGAAWLVWNLL